MGGPTNEDDLVYLRLVDLGVPENLLDGLKRGTEQVLAELLDANASEGGVEINTSKRE